MNKRLRLPLALALALGGSHAYALGLGQIEVKSALNQPLVAEIPVLVSSPGEADNLAVRLASPDAFERVGLDRPALQAANLQFEVQTDARGRKVIRITTPNGVADPFLSFLLEVDWGKGRLLREYTVLLDPPSMAPITASAPAAASAVPEPAPARTEPLEAPPPLPAAPAPQPEPAPVAAAPAPVAAPQEPAPSSYPGYGTDSYTVAAGETLWSIAQRNRPDDSVTINQMMMALLRANPDAFIGNNINRLKKGAVLRIPGRDETTVVAAAEAAAQVRDQMQAWGGPASTVAQPADGTPGTAATRTTAASRNESRLELTPPRDASGDGSASQSGAAADGSGRELRAELARAREEASALSQENMELKSRVGELEELRGESRRLLELKDSELAAAQRRLAELEAAAGLAPSAAAAPADTPAVPEESTGPVEGDIDTAAVAEAQADVDPASAAEPDTTAEPGSIAAEEQVSEPVALAEPEPAPAPATEPAADPAPAQPAPASDSAFNPWLIGGGAAVLLGLVGLLAMRRRKNKADAVLPAAAASSTPAVVDYEPEQEEIELVEAISQYPNDLQLHLDLLRHYYTRNDAVAFESAAEAMYAQVYDSNDPAWLEVREMGAQIAPAHPLFAASPDVEDVAQAYGLGADDSSTGFDDPVMDPVAAEPSRDAFETAVDTDAPAEAADEREIDWFSSGSSGTEAAPAAEPSGGQNHDFDSFDSPSVQAVAESDDFIDSVGQADADEDFSAIDADAAATKLELGRAYLDMGDAEGARGMLEEVLNEGNAEQREEARRLLDGIA